MEITAGLVKELRERSGAGMMECKNALKETAGNVDAALDHLRKTGVLKAAKKAGRIAAEGVVVIRRDDAAGRAVIVEINSETDFAAKREEFTTFADGVAATILARRPADVAALGALPLNERTATVESVRAELVAKIGENIAVRRFDVLENRSGTTGTYLHGARIGVLVGMKGGDVALARDIAMHIAASRPMCIQATDIAPEVLDKEREIARAQAATSGKPPEIVEKMVSGRIQKFIKEVTLLGQPFVKDDKKDVGALLKAAQATVQRFICYEVGEGIEKKPDNFANEVQAQARAAQTPPPDRH